MDLKMVYTLTAKNAFHHIELPETPSGTISKPYTAHSFRGKDKSEYLEPITVDSAFEGLPSCPPPFSQYIMVRIIRQPELVPGHLRRLIYASIILSFITFGLSMGYFGFHTLFVGPIAVVFTWIYHLVLIVKHNKSYHASNPIRLPLLWSTTQALVWGYALAILWTAAFSIILWRFLVVFIVWGRYYDMGFDAILIVSFSEIVFTMASGVVMWALVALATHVRRTGKWNSEVAQLHKRAGPREWINGMQLQEQNRTGEA
ncbi:hypothetical protein DL96DRAFT_1590638 [Flagelloscypha sp. PMI_526]|nr:hypothetical protein DL96DRAFT_1590638 [Flagelloscypha sp. PMI_526]